MRYIDVHCHLDGGHYGDLDGLFARLKACSVEKVINAGFDVKSSIFGGQISKTYPECYFTAGIHPTETKGFDGDLQVIYGLAKDKKCVAIGEIGLDYHYPDTDAPLQRKVFSEQIALAHEVGLPVQIHSRDCAEETLEILKANKSLLSCGFLLHCFSYSPEIAREIEKLGGSFSFGGSSTYSKKAKRAIAQLGISSLMTETDSPYLAPASRQGQFPNTPESIPEILENLAAVRAIGAEEAAEAVWQNAHRLFTKLL